MFEALDKVILAGLGALSMTKKRAEKMFDDAVARGQEVRANRKRFVTEMMDSASRAKMTLEEVVSKQVQQAVHKMNLPTRGDLSRVEDKLDQLLSRKTGSK